jgi:hypothetical protein
MIMTEQLTDYEARRLLVTAGIETGDDPRSYLEIAQQFGLVAIPRNVEVTLPVAESAV